MAFDGTIRRLQVQRSSLKFSEGRAKWYDPAPIVSVPGLVLTEDGVYGVDVTGEEMVDVHNATHPESKNRRGTNGISICFTSHYEAMRERFGGHLVDGLAGENILIETDEMITLEDLVGGLVIRNGAGDEIRLTNIIVAAPCVEFSRFALQFPKDAKPDRTVSETVKFLNDGMRGFYATFPENGTGRISVGDHVVRPE